MTSTKKKLTASNVAALLTAAGTVAVSAPASAASCVYTLGKSTYYDYAWVTDKNDVCGYMAVKHFYYPGGPGVWTQWYGGSQHHYQTPQEPQLSSAQYSLS